MITRWIAGVVVLFGILLMMLPKTDEQSVARIGSASMLMCSREFRAAVGRQVLGGEPVSVEFDNRCPDLIGRLEVDEEGEMVITGNKHPVTMTLRPVIEGAAVRWSCVGEPAEQVTRFCKP